MDVFSQHNRSIVLWTVLMAFSACGKSSVSLTWTLGCDQNSDEDAQCVISSARDCSKWGIDALEVLVLRGSSVSKRIFPCFSQQSGAVGEVPLPSGGDELLIVAYGLAPDGHRVVGPSQLTISANDDRVRNGKIIMDLPAPPQCGDGLDNDLDGRPDLADSNCDTLQDDDEGR